MPFPGTPAEIRDRSQAEFQTLMLATGKIYLLARLADTTDIKQRQKGLKTAHLPRQPGDFLVKVWGSPMFVAEVKGTINEKGFRFSSAFEPMQLQWLNGMAAMDAAEEYRVFIRSYSNDAWYCLKPKAVVNFIDQKRLVPFSELEPFKYGLLPQ